MGFALQARVVDYIVIIAYLVVSFALGVVGSRLLGLSGDKEEDYFLAGRKMPGWLNGLSNAATALNSDVAPLYCGVAVAAGLSGAWFYLSRFGFGMLIVSLLFAVKWRQMRVRTGPEFFSLRYGRGSKFARVYASLSSVLLGMVPWIGAGMLGMHKVAGPIFGYQEMWITLIVVLPLLTIYVWSSGLGGVLITDGLQGTVIIIGNLVLVISVLVAFGGPSGMGRALTAAYEGRSESELRQLAAQPRHYQTQVDGYRLYVQVCPEYTSGYFAGERNAPAVKREPTLPAGGSGVPYLRRVERVGGYAVAMTWFEASAPAPGALKKAPPLPVEADLATLKLGENTYTFSTRPKFHSSGVSLAQASAEITDAARYGANLSSTLPVPDNRVVGPIGVICWLLISVVGAGGGVASDGQRYFSCRNNYEAAKVGIWGNVALFGMLLLLMLPVLGMLARYPEVHFVESGLAETIYGRMLIEFLPAGAVGITVAAMLASVMSTVSTHLNYGSQTLLNDVYRPLFGEPKPGREVHIGRLLMLIIVGLSIVISLEANSLMGITMVVVGLFGASATFGWAQWWWWRVNIWGWVSSVVTGPVFYVLFGELLPLIPWWREQMERSESNMAIVQAIIAMVLSTLCWLVVTLLTKPEDMERLKEFYLRARPAGIWGPVRRELIAEGKLEDEPAKLQLLPGFLIAIVGFAMMASGTLAVAALFIGNWPLTAAYLAAAAVTGLVFRKLFYWHLKRLGADIDFYVS